MSNQEAKKSKEYLENLLTIIRDGPAKFNASEPVMQHLNCLWSRLNKALLESDPEPTEFTEKRRRFFTRPLFTISWAKEAGREGIEACGIIESQAAENDKLKRLLRAIDEWEDDTASLQSCEDLRGRVKEALKGD